MAVGVVFVLNRPVYEHFISWNGPVGRDMDRRIDTLIFRAKSTVGVDTGALKANIRVLRKWATKSGLSAQVGARRDYTMAHHEGARPHVIRARRAQALRFQVGGRILFRTSVRHPGNRANPFLSRWLDEFVS